MIGEFRDEIEFVSRICVVRCGKALLVMGVIQTAFLDEILDYLDVIPRTRTRRRQQWIANEHCNSLMKGGISQVIGKVEISVVVAEHLYKRSLRQQETSRHSCATCTHSDESFIPGERRLM